jgi:hypothetical protein
VIVVKVEAWDDPDGASVREIGRLVMKATGAEGETGDYLFTIDEGERPLVRPLRHRGVISRYERRQSVWALVNRILTKSLMEKTMQ